MNNKITKLILVLLGSSQIHATPASADERLDYLLSLSLEELARLEVSISTETKQPISEAPAVVTVITKEDIRATGATNLVDVLEGVPGIHVRASQFGNRPLIQFRGANARQTLLMVNGASLKDLMWGFGIFWKGLPASMIERVEIIRGPGSALFGADASAGVINVITKTAGKIEHNEVGARAGSFDTYTTWGQYGGNWNGFDVGFTAELSTTNGHDPFIEADGQTAQDLRNGTNTSLAPGTAEYGWGNMDLRFSLAKGPWRLHADYVRHSNLEIGLTGAGILDPVTEASDSWFNIDLLYDNPNFAPNWGVNAELRFQHLDYSSGQGFQEHPPGAFNGDYPDGVINKMRSAERRAIIEASGLYSGFENHALRLGAGHIWQDLYFVEQFINMGTGPDGEPLPPGSPLVDVSDTPYAFAPEKTRNIDYLFLQDIWNLSDDLELTTGVRYDNYSDFGDTLNPRIGLVWQTNDRLTTKVMYGEAFRAPSYQELFAETSFTLPNADLEPEKSKTWDLSFSYAANKALRVDLILFHFQQEDLIRAIPVDGLSKRQFQNQGEHTIRGIELEAWWEAAKNLRISGNYTYRDQDESEFRAFDEPNQEAYLRADGAFGSQWTWNVQANWIGKRERASNDTRPSVDDHVLTDATLRYRASRNWEISASIRNLFDVNAREYTGRSIPNDLPLPERNFYLEARYSFDDNL
ncbi:MAG: TonB-dependent receptor [Chromatiales bacterium]|nr:TonB-dependent receptor [Chromatiales bacterium]